MASKNNLRLQSATEYLLTYGWAFLIAGVVIAALYLFVFAPITLSSNTCTFFSGVYCQDMILGSNSVLSKMAMLLSNTNSYPVINPTIIVNISGIAPVQGSCVPNFVLPGGAIICNATIIPAVSQSSLASGQFVLSYTPCPGGNVIECQSNSAQSFTGSFSIHSSPLLSPTTLSIDLTPQNVSQVAFSTTLDKLTAYVDLLGSPVSGATVNFTSSSLTAPLNPTVTTTDGSGDAFSYISSNIAQTVTVNAYFANVASNTIITFNPPVCYTVASFGSGSFSSNVLTLDGVGYSSLPQQLCYGQGTTHAYSFQTTVSGGPGTQYLINGVSGCGVTALSGTISVSSNCTITPITTTQYSLTTSASPSIGGTVSPASGWYNSGNSATLGETPSAGYLFNGWTGTGVSSYTGATHSPVVVLNNPITEIGSFSSTTTTSTSTTSSTSTSTTSTSTSTSTTSTSTSTSTSSTTSTRTTTVATTTVAVVCTYKQISTESGYCQCFSQCMETNFNWQGCPACTVNACGC